MKAEAPGPAAAKDSTSTSDHTTILEICNAKIALLPASELIVDQAVDFLAIPVA